MATCKIWWVRRDLRLDDNPALARAASGADALIPVFIGGDADEGAWPLGGAQRWPSHWLVSRVCLPDHARDKQVERDPDG